MNTSGRTTRGVLLRAMQSFVQGQSIPDTGYRGKKRDQSGLKSACVPTKQQDRMLSRVKHKS